MTQKRSPSQTHRFFLYDPLGEGFAFFKSPEEREAAAKRIIPEYVDPDFGTWDEDVEEMFAGEVTHIVQQADSIDRPARDQLDKFNYDESGEHWPPEWDYKCNYELKPVKGGNTDGQ